MATIKDLKFDDKNFNKHTEFGMSKLEESLRNYGAGRSILIDKYNNIIAGNGVIESAGQIGLEKVRIIETIGDEIVAVKRTDIDLNTKKGREMALADNAISDLDLNWDFDNLGNVFSKKELENFGIKIPKDLNIKDLSDELNFNEFVVEIKCKNEEEQELIFNEMTERGYSCKTS